MCTLNPSNYPPTSLSPGEFHQQVEAVWETSLAKNQIKKKQAEQKNQFINKCYQLYLNAFQGQLPFMVIGNDKLCESVEELSNFGVLSTDEPFCQKEIKGLSERERHQGTVLSQTQWCVLLNDSYILGAIHACKSFHLCDPHGDIENRFLWDTQFQRPRILGRELMMLETAGYQRYQQEHPKLEKVFVPTSFNGKKISLKQLIDTSEKVNSLDQIKSFIHAETALKKISQKISALFQKLVS